MTSDNNNKPSIDIGAIGVPAVPQRSPGGASGGYGKKPSKGFTFYKLHTVDKNDTDKSRPNYRITKFDEDLNVESSYVMNYMPSANGGYYDCQCPASKFDCRHKAIMKEIEAQGKVDSEAFFCFETRTFKLAEEIK